jgi:outer membrane lipoprotein-sorting protein
MIRKTVASAAALVAAGAFLSAGYAQAATPTASAILDFDKNFSDANGSQGVGGKAGSCTNVQPGLVSSVDFNDGRMHLFTGAGCTGRSIVIDGDVTDLGALGFDKLTASVELG